MLCAVMVTQAQTRSLSAAWESWRVTDPMLLERASQQIEEHNLLAHDAFPSFREEDELIVFRPKRSRDQIIMVWYGNDRDGYVFLKGSEATRLFSQSLLRAFLREDLYKHAPYPMRKGKKFYPRISGTKRPL